MKTLTFYGSSDDLLEVEGDIIDEFDAYKGASVLLKSSNGAMRVHATYAPKYLPVPVWAIGVAPEDEDNPIPGWEMRYALSDTGYSAALTIIAPDDVIIVPLAEEDIDQ